MVLILAVASAVFYVWERNFNSFTGFTLFFLVTIALFISMFFARRFWRYLALVAVFLGVLGIVQRYYFVKDENQAANFLLNVPSGQ